MISISNLTINFSQSSSILDKPLENQSKIVVREELTSLLRIISEDPRILGQTVLIPDDCEKYGFAEGTFDLPTLLHFLADMLE